MTQIKTVQLKPAPGGNPGRKGKAIMIKKLKAYFAKRDKQRAELRREAGIITPDEYRRNRELTGSGLSDV